MVKKKIKNNKKDTVIRVANLSKTFKVPHEKHTTLKSATLNLLKRKTFTEFCALDSISFEVQKGEFFGIIGRNGSGKSTLLKILAGIYVPDEGKAKISGKLSPFLELGVGFNPELTGRENLYLGGSILGISRKEIDEKFDKIVTFSELGDFIDMKLKNYSSGMQVRLAFSLSINVHADILLMDEVLAVGDTNFQSKCLAEFNKYKNVGKTVILVSHDVATIQRYCDRAMLLRNGKIVKLGNADEVGNEYIRQNISDEEKRTANTTKDQLVDNNIQSRIKITKAAFLDENGLIKNVFKTGDDLVMRIYFKNRKPLKNVNFGVAIFNQENNCINGISTVIDKNDNQEFIKKGYFQVVFRNIPLKKNKYYINAAIFGENHATVYDFAPRIKEFSIFSQSQNDGLVEIDHKWKA